MSQENKFQTIGAVAAEMKSAVSLSKQFGTPVGDHQLILDWAGQLFELEERMRSEGANCPPAGADGREDWTIKNHHSHTGMWAVFAPTGRVTPWMEHVQDADRLAREHNASLASLRAENRRLKDRLEGIFETLAGRYSDITTIENGLEVAVLEREGLRGRFENAAQLLNRTWAITGKMAEFVDAIAELDHDRMEKLTAYFRSNKREIDNLSAEALAFFAQSKPKDGS